jgi:hypothetical protein
LIAGRGGSGRSYPAQPAHLLSSRLTGFAPAWWWRFLAGDHSVA